MASLDDLVEVRGDRMIADLQELIRIDSVKGAEEPGAPFGRRVKDALDFYLAKGRAYGFEVKDVHGYAGHLEFGQGDELVGVLMHLDVVPAGEGWSHPPFAGEIADGRLYGRGTMDDKGPAVACLHALCALRESGLTPRRRLRLIVGCDEESNWDCVRHYFSLEERPDYGFSPDAEFPLIFAEKGSLALRWWRPWTGMPAGAATIQSVSGGTRFNVVPDWCEARVAMSEATTLQVREALSNSGVPLTLIGSPDGLLIQARGLAVHASQPERGENAIGRLFRGLLHLGPWLPEEQAEIIRFIAEKVGSSYNGSGMDLAVSDDVSGALTLGPGTINWDRAGVSLEIDVRYPVSYVEEEIMSRIGAHAGKAGFEITILHGIPPLHVPVDHPLVTKLMGVYTEKTGDNSPPVAIGGRTYAYSIGTGVAFGPTFRGQVELAHQRDEYVDLAELMLSAKIYAGAMAALLGD